VAGQHPDTLQARIDNDDVIVIGRNERRLALATDRSGIARRERLTSDQ
jgi:hypothetical protein